MPGTLQKRQSVKPSLAVALSIAAVLVVTGVIWLAVGLAKSYGGSSCPSHPSGTTRAHASCR